MDAVRLSLYLYLDKKFKLFLKKIKELNFEQFLILSLIYSDKIYCIKRVLECNFFLNIVE